MEDFSWKIFVNHILLQFHFHKVLNSSHLRYHISVKDATQKAHHFEMERLGQNSWKIIDAPKVPDWIHALESQLEKAILFNL